MADSLEGLGFLIADVARLMRRAFQARFDGGPVTYEQARALVQLSRQQGLRQVDLAERLEIQPITLARIVDRLAEAGLVERRPDPTDRRAYRLHLTPAAGPLVARIREVGRAVRGEALAGLSARDAALAVALLGRMRDALASPQRPSRGEGPQA
jgi:DNA-binding MarR family transcriptional regulator